MEQVRICAIPKAVRKEQATNYYQIWFNVKDGEKEDDFFRHAQQYLYALKDRGVIESWEFFKRTPSARSSDEAPFNVTLVVKDLDKFGEDFREVATRHPELEDMHNNVVSRVKEVHLSIYKDLADVIGRG